MNTNWVPLTEDYVFVVLAVAIIVVAVTTCVRRLMRPRGKILNQKDLSKLESIARQTTWIHEDLTIPYPACCNADARSLSRSISTLQEAGLCILARDRRLSMNILRPASGEGDLLRALEAVYPDLASRNPVDTIQMKVDDYVVSSVVVPRRGTVFLPFSAFNINDDPYAPLLAYLHTSKGVTCLIHAAVRRRNWDRQIRDRLHVLQWSIQQANLRGDDATELKRIKHEIQRRSFEIAFALIINIVVLAKDKNKAENAIRTVESCVTALPGPGRFTSKRADPMKVLRCVLWNEGLIEIPATPDDLTCIVHLPVRPIGFSMKHSSVPVLGRLPSADEQSIQFGWEG